MLRLERKEGIDRLREGRVKKIAGAALFPLLVAYKGPGLQSAAGQRVVETADDNAATVRGTEPVATDFRLAACHAHRQAEHGEGVARGYKREQGRLAPQNWQENVERMLSCEDIREGYHEYLC